jgi:dimethylamine/trimethylamine dehydrogenase
MAEGKQAPDGRVLIYDCDGYYMGVSLAEKFASEGREVTLVTPYSTAGPFLAFTAEAAHVHHTLERLKVQVVVDHVLTEIEPGQIRGRALFGDLQPSWEAHGVVLVTHRLSDGLYRELSSAREDLEREGITGLYRVGDCVEPRLVADAIFDGHRLARDIDTDDPRKFQPFMRENLKLPPADLPHLAATATAT